MAALIICLCALTRNGDFTCAVMVPGNLDGQMQKSVNNLLYC